MRPLRISSHGAPGGHWEDDPARQDKTPESQATQEPTHIDLTEDQLRRQLELYSPVDIFRRIFLRPKPINRALKINESVRRSTLGYRPNELHAASFSEEKAEPHQTGDLATDLFHAQIKACEHPFDVVRILNTAFQDPDTAKVFATQSIQSAALSKVKEQDDYRAILEALVAFHKRFQEQGLTLDFGYVELGLRVAAKLPHFTAVRHWLDIIGSREDDRRMQDPRLIIHGILQDFRRGVATAKGPVDTKALLACLYGFPDRTPKSLRERINPFSISEWNMLLALLADIGASNKLLAEWGRASDESQPGNLTCSQEHAQQIPLSFMKAFFHVDMPEKAWHIFQKHGETMLTDVEAWRLMLGNGASMPKLDPEMVKKHSAGLLVYLEEELEELEKKLDMSWQADPQNPASSRHTLGRTHAIANMETWFEGFMSEEHASKDEAEQGNARSQGVAESDDDWETLGNNTSDRKDAREVAKQNPGGSRAKSRRLGLRDRKKLRDQGAPTTPETERSSGQAERAVESDSSVSSQRQDRNIVAEARSQQDPKTSKDADSPKQAAPKVTNDRVVKIDDFDSFFGSKAPDKKRGHRR
ncbi:MAG: hypothetical protein M1828_002126 [Chrysothrix sp. TS-e1954]|nr:MAG: hypothetical protein M1828_002126 [Chrysothrix sp. TS-e1954]